MLAQKRKASPRTSRRASSGFSLIELLIVVAVILVIAAIAIPNFIRSKMRANEASAVANIRNITTGEVVYSTTYGVGYSSDLAKLGGSTVIVDQNNAGLIDSVLSSGVKSGYSFTYDVVSTDASGNVQAYSVNADPLIPGQSGDRHFYSDQSATIRQNYSASAGPTDQPLQ